MEIPKYKQPSKETWHKFAEALMKVRSPEAAAYREEKLNRKRNNRKVYFIVDGGLIKIGVSEYPEARLDEIKTSRPFARLLGFIDGGYELEKNIHTLLAKYNYGREWFYYNKEVNNVIKDYLK